MRSMPSTHSSTSLSIAIRIIFTRILTAIYTASLTTPGYPHRHLQRYLQRQSYPYLYHLLTGISTSSSTTFLSPSSAALKDLYSTYLYLERQPSSAHRSILPSFHFNLNLNLNLPAPHCPLLHHMYISQRVIRSKNVSVQWRANFHRLNAASRISKTILPWQ